MTTRIAVIGTGFHPVGDSRPPQEITRIVSAGLDARLFEIPDGVFPSSPAAREVVDRQYLEAGRRAGDAGFDAVYVNTVGDYGLAEMRDELGIPVIGAGETAYRTAASRGRFAIVTIWPPMLDFIQERVLGRSGTAKHCIGITHLASDEDMDTLGDEENFVTDLRSCSLTSMTRIREARDVLIGEGAGAVVLGCTCMAPAAAVLPAHTGGVTLEPMTLGYRFAEYCLVREVAPEEVDYGQASHWLG